jgi:hypothetical protein
MKKWKPEINFYETPPSKVIFSNMACEIVRDYRGYVIAKLYQPWSKKHEGLIGKYKVDGISIVLSAKSSDNSLKFLMPLKNLRLLIVFGNSETQWERIDYLTNLEHLHALSSDQPPQSINFIGLRALRVCIISACPTWSNIFHHPSVQSLAWQGDFKSESLDCSNMRKLKEIVVDSAPRLRNISLHDSVRLLSLGIEKCRSFAVGWDRLCKDLRFLAIQGRVSFPISEISKAKELRSLLLFNVGKLESAEFLMSLSNLRWLRFLDVKMSEADLKIYRDVKAAMGPPAEEA